MLRNILLLLGILLVTFQRYLLLLSPIQQLLIFLVGIVLLGIPHGAIDLLVANKTATDQQKKFSTVVFLGKYISCLVVFGLIIYFFPLIGNVLFLLIATYHFGETDLNNFKTDKILGKLFISSYGMVILAVIILPHFNEVKPMLMLFESGKSNEGFINYIDINKTAILSIVTLLFFVITFTYFISTEEPTVNAGKFILQLALLVFILYQLNLIIGFTLYFVVWHSTLSIWNIIRYLKQDKSMQNKTIIKQLMLYSCLAITGLGLFGFAGSMFGSMSAMVLYTFLGLAVLTAPHMQIMYSMYIQIKKAQGVNSN